MPESKPKFQDRALEDLAQLFIRDSQDPAPGNDAIYPEKFDFSVQSLAEMDAHLELMRRRNLSPDERIRFVLRSGAYVGEVIRRNSPAPKQWHWMDYDQAVAIEPKLKSFGKDLGTLAVLWDAREGFTFPLAKILKYLQNGAGDSVKFFAEVIIARPPSSRVDQHIQ